MAIANLLSLLDDIATIMDDVAVFSKVAMKKTAGVLGDDLALNAQQVTGMNANRELPVIWRVAKGSFWNKVILVPAALIISYFAPPLVGILLMIGGLYLCYEGFEKVVHRFWPHGSGHMPEGASDSASAPGSAHESAEAAGHSAHDGAAAQGAAAHGTTQGTPAAPDPAMMTPDDAARARQFATGWAAGTSATTAEETSALEMTKIKGAVRTDFVLSAEIVAISLATLTEEPILSRTITLAVVAIAFTIGVYGFVAIIVKLDDLGLWLMQRPGHGVGARIAHALGSGFLWFAPLLMKFLSIAGTVAMFLVGGGIIAHGIEPIEHAITSMNLPEFNVPAIDGIVGALVPSLGHMAVGIAAGALALAAVKLVGRMRPAKRQATS